MVTVITQNRNQNGEFQREGIHKSNLQVIDALFMLSNGHVRNLNCQL